MITLDEKTARQVLEALIWTTGSTDFGKFGHAHEGALKLLFPAINALRQALEPKPCNMGQMCLDCQPRGANGECPDQQPKQEPVAYSCTSRITGNQTFSLHPKPQHFDSYSWDIKPLYTEPPQRNPLTRDQALKIVAANPDAMTAIQMTEAAHGIKEK